MLRLPSSCTTSRTATLLRGQRRGSENYNDKQGNMPAFNLNYILHYKRCKNVNSGDVINNDFLLLYDIWYICYLEVTIEIFSTQHIDVISNIRYVESK